MQIPSRSEAAHEALMSCMWLRSCGFEPWYRCMKNIVEDLFSRFKVCISVCLNPSPFWILAGDGIAINSTFGNFTIEGSTIELNQGDGVRYARGDVNPRLLNTFCTRVSLGESEMYPLTLLGERTNSTGVQCDDVVNIEMFGMKCLKC